MRRGFAARITSYLSNYGMINVFGNANHPSLAPAAPDAHRTGENLIKFGAGDVIHMGKS